MTLSSSMVTGGQRLYFEARSTRDRDDWLKAIRGVIASFTMPAMAVLSAGAAVHSLLSIDSHTICGGCDDALLKMWSIEIGPQGVSQHSCQDIYLNVEHDQSLHRLPELSCLARSQSNSVVCAAAGRNVYLFRTPMKSGCAEVLRGHSYPVTSLLVADDETLWSASRDCSIRQWDTKSLRCMKQLQRRVTVPNNFPTTCVLLSSNPLSLLAGQKNGEIDAWSQGASDAKKLSPPEGTRDGVVALCSVWGHFVWSAHADGTVVIWR